jgi:uncharacterized protein (DUF983 family)
MVPEQATTPSSGLKRFGRRLWAILRLRCPRCFQGTVFRGSFQMNEACPDCGVRFEREQGYFLGAMYASYFLGCGFLTVFYFTLSAFFPDWPTILLAAVAMLPYLPLVPAVFRYSRVLWMHIDSWEKSDAAPTHGRGDS